MELSALESVPDFARLSKGMRSDLGAALRLYREWQAEPERRGNVVKTTIADTEAIAA